MILIEILPNLYLGDAQSVKYKSQLNIASQINCQRDLMYLGTHTEYVHNIKKNIEQYELVGMYQYLTESINFIHKNILKDNAVLVYCDSGNQKASTVIAAYIIKYGKVDADTAIKMIRSKNKTSFYPNIDFYNSLKMIQNDL
jgi:protein-tyrosine phosphatase